jgi:hypothetical protein
VTQPRGVDAGRVPRLAAARVAAFVDALGAATRAVVARQGLLGGAAGIGCGLGVSVLLWWTVRHGLESPGVAIAAVTLLAAALLAAPVRAVAGAFALTVSLAVVGLALGFFITAPAGVTPTGATVAPQADLEGSAPPSTPSGQVTEQPAPHAAPSRPTRGTFAYAAFTAPARRGWDAGTPCHSPSRASTDGSTRRSQLTDGPCELRDSRDR